MSTRVTKKGYSNVFGVNAKWKLNRMINKNKSTLVIIIYIAPNDEASMNAITPIKELSKKYPNYYFMFVDVKNFDDLNTDYYDVQYVPLYIVYYNGIPVSQYIGLNFDLIKKNLELLTNTLINKSCTPSTQSLQESEESLHSKGSSNEGYDDNIEKATYMRKLFMLTKQGVQLTNSYSMDSDLDEIIWEYNLHVNPHKLRVDSTYKKPICFNDKHSVSEQSKSDKSNKNKSNKSNKSNDIKSKIIDTQSKTDFNLSKLLSNPELSKLLKNIAQKKKEVSDSDSSDDSDNSDSSENSKSDTSSYESDENERNDTASTDSDSSSGYSSNE